MYSSIYLNPLAGGWRTTSTVEKSVKSFHESLPDYNSTPLVSLDGAAKELGVGRLFIKDESSRFGLPAFKILGASWAIYRGVTQITGLPHTASLAELSDASRMKGVRLVSCSEGNWGRAVARMAKLLNIQATIYVPKYCHEATIRKIASEGAKVPVVDGNYDASVEAARADADSTGALLVMDTSWPGYEEIPAWVVEGYSTMLAEVDEQIQRFTSNPVTHAVASVGVGSWAHAVTVHYKSEHPSVSVIIVEPDTAAGVRTSLENGKITTVETADSIMCGMNCGTPSLIAWPVLRAGVDAAVAVTDLEAHQAVQYLHANRVMAGPCGAAPLAALRKLKKENILQLGADSIVVLFCTEGVRDYPSPN